MVSYKVLDLGKTFQELEYFILKKLQKKLTNKQINKK